MARYDYDLFTIGAGSGGVRASRMSAAFGAKVAVAEERYLGGTCVNVGCIPKKLLVYASHYGDDFQDAAGYGWTAGGRFDWATLIANKNAEIQRLNGIYRKLLTDAGVTIIEAHAEIIDRHTVLIDGKKITAQYLLVAVGSWPMVPRFPGSEHAITSNEAFYLRALPKRVIIVGGGYTGVEFSGIFHGLGARTTQLYWNELFLRGFDIDIRRSLAEEMRKRGIDLRFKADIVRIEKSDTGLRATLTDGSIIEADQILYATGRLSNTPKLGLENIGGVGLKENGAVIVDAYSQSTVENIYAIGDCTDRMMLTPVAIAEGMAVAHTLFNNKPTKPDYLNVPTAIFSAPNCGTVGLTEDDARANDFEIDIYRSRFKPLKHTLSGRDERTMMKLVVDRTSDRVLGCHMVGADAGEIIQGLAIALNCGATKAQFDATLGIHPTAAEEFVTMRTRVID